MRRSGRDALEAFVDHRKIAPAAAPELHSSIASAIEEWFATLASIAAFCLGVISVK